MVVRAVNEPSRNFHSDLRRLQRRPSHCWKHLLVTEKVLNCRPVGAFTKEKALKKLREGSLTADSSNSRNHNKHIWAARTRTREGGGYKATNI